MVPLVPMLDVYIYISTVVPNYSNISIFHPISLSDYFVSNFFIGPLLTKEQRCLERQIVQRREGQVCCIHAFGYPDLLTRRSRIRGVAYCSSLLCSTG